MILSRTILHRAAGLCLSLELAPKGNTTVGQLDDDLVIVEPKAIANETIFEQLGHEGL